MPLLDNNENQVVYGRSMGSRVFSGVASVGIFAMFAAFLVMFMPSREWLQDRSPLEAVGRLSYPVLAFLMGVGIVISGVYGAGPDDLLLDLKTRRYRFRRGFPLLARWQSGGFDDIEAIYVRERQGKNVTAYWMMLAWKGGGRKRWFPIADGAVQTRKDVFLGVSRSLSETLTQMQALAARLGVEAVPSSSERYNAGPLARQRMASRLTPAIAAAGFVFLLLFSGPELWIQHQLDAQGRTTQGRVLSLRHGKYSWVTAEYTVGGRTLRREDQVRRDALDTLTPGMPLTVTYLPDHPRTSRTNLSNARRSSTTFLSLYGGFLILGTLAQIVTNRKKSRALQASES